MTRDSSQSSFYNSGKKLKKRALGSMENKPVFIGFEMNAILRDKTKYHCEITTVGSCPIY